MACASCMLLIHHKDTIEDILIGRTTQCVWCVYVRVCMYVSVILFFDFGCHSTSDLVETVLAKDVERANLV